MSEELKPCPFCGGQPTEMVIRDCSPSGYAFIGCESEECNGSAGIERKIRDWDITETGESKDATWSILRGYWNTRHYEAETKRLREALQLVKDKKTSRWHPSDPVLAIINSAIASAEQQNTNKG